MAYHPPKQRMQCATCSNYLYHSPRSKKPPRCVDCGIKAMLKANNEISKKQGPGYDKWFAGTQKFLEENPPTTPLPSQQPDEKPTTVHDP